MRQKAHQIGAIGLAMAFWASSMSSPPSWVIRRKRKCKLCGGTGFRVTGPPTKKWTLGRIKRVECRCTR
jgi:hypothetical protein